MNKFLIILAILLVYALLFGVGEFFFKRGVHAYITRKIVHIFAGILTALLPLFVDMNTAIAIGLLASLLLFITKRKKMLHCVHESSSGSMGSLLFAPALTLTAIIFWPINVVLFQSSVLVLAISDGLAGLFGVMYGKKSFFISGRKTYLGSFVFFISTTLLYIQALNYRMMPIETKLIPILVASLIMTFVEAVFARGWDNLFIPLLSGAILYTML